MTGYEYTKINCIDLPHKYMYAPYLGSEFLSSYFKDRLEYLKISHKVNSVSIKNRDNYSLYSKALNALYEHLDREFPDELNELLKIEIDWKSVKLNIYPVKCLNTNIVNLSNFSLDDEVNSEKLLLSLLSSQLNGKDDRAIKIWLDCLVQRFEVTKKIYEYYPIGFRKGTGRGNIVYLYGLFALSLSLFYISTKSIKYLSTLLKAIDLICSLDKQLVYKEISPQGLSLVMLVEWLSIKSLSESIAEVNFDFT